MEEMACRTSTATCCHCVRTATFPAPTVDSLGRMLDMFGPQGSVEHVDVQ